LKRDSIPRQALLKARNRDVIVLSPDVESEIREVLTRPKFARHLTEEDRSTILTLLMDAAVRIEPALTVHDCRDAKDNKYLALAAAAGAGIIISSDKDLLVLDPWRGIRIVSPADFLAMV
jgi:hypothetical protein